ncbi:MAG TPA: hypothetical protein VNV65_05345 [Candidatus Solibacter sp.]|jgi:hypothetical protein|nr:hypothetical protein [Candidatus Solibacter sp.]
MPQFEVVEDSRRVPPGKAGTLIPSWNTGFDLRSGPDGEQTTGAVVRPGQKLHVLESVGGNLKVRQEANGYQGWLPGHIVAPWPE